MSLMLKAMLTCLLGSLLALPKTACADSAAGSSPGAKIDSHTQSKTEEKRKTLMADATIAIQQTQAALKHLDDGRSREALADLERATGKLDVILARDSKLELAPAGVNVVTYDVEGGLDAVKRVRQQAEELMNEGRLQAARAVLKNLASETVVSVSNIPLASYPDAIKRAVKLIDENKTDAAKQVLQTALNTQIITETIIPLPVVRAEESLKTAETLAERKDRTKDDNAQLKTAMENARNQLEYAQALGYGRRNDFDRMYGQLNEIGEKTANNRSGTGWFAKIKASVSNLLKSSQTPNGK